MENDPDSSYAAAGVDLDLAQRAKAGLSSAVASTATPLTLDAFGSFGGVIRIPEDIPDPAIVASIDGVGTKLHLAIKWGARPTPDATWSTTASTTSPCKTPGQLRSLTT